MSNFHSLGGVCRVSETQLKVSEKIITMWNCNAIDFNEEIVKPGGTL